MHYYLSSCEKKRSKLYAEALLTSYRLDCVIKKAVTPFTCMEIEFQDNIGCFIYSFSVSQKSLQKTSFIVVAKKTASNMFNRNTIIKK